MTVEVTKERAATFDRCSSTATLVPANRLEGTKGDEHTVTTFNTFSVEASQAEPMEHWLAHSEAGEAACTAISLHVEGPGDLTLLFSSTIMTWAAGPKVQS
jgi:hypothetical protein